MSASTTSNKPSTSKSTLSFVAWTASIFVYLCFTAWAILPGKTLHAIGVTYYPSRYYAIALPAYVIVVYALSGIVYIGVNLLNTKDPEDIATIRDDQTSVSTLSAPLTFIKCGGTTAKDNGIPDIGDIDPVLVSTVLKP